MLRKGLYQISFYKRLAILNDERGYLTDEYYIDKFINEISKNYDILITHIKFDVTEHGCIEFICFKKDAIKIYKDALSIISFMDDTSFERASLFHELKIRLKYL